MKRFFVILVLVVGFFILKTLYQAGQFKSITNSFKGQQTTTYTNMPGPEDMQYDNASGLLFISSANRRQGGQGREGIYRLNVKNDKQPILVGTDFAGEFHPHGLSLFRQDSMLYLFVVNHSKSGDFVESFTFQDDFLNHIRTYSYPKLCCPNDVVAVGTDKFYVTNDHGTKSGIRRTIEDYLRIPQSNVFYFDGAGFKKAAGPFHYANGINISPDSKHLYVAETTGAAINTYEIEADGSLVPKATIDVDTGVDNIDVDTEGNLWIGAHPKLLDFVKHVPDSTNLSPSQVIKLTPDKDHNFTIEQIFLNDGSAISASSVAVPVGNELFIGAVVDRTVFRGTLKN